MKKRIVCITLVLVMAVCSLSFQNVKMASAKSIWYTVLGDYSINTKRLATRGSLFTDTDQESNSNKRNFRITANTKFYQYYGGERLLKKKKDKLIAIRSANIDKNKLDILVGDNEIKKVVIWYYPPGRYIPFTDIPFSGIWNEVLEKYSINTNRLVTSGSIICYNTNGVIKYKAAQKRTFHIMSSTEIYKYSDMTLVKLKKKGSRSRAIRNANINKYKLEIALNGQKIKYLVICEQSV